MLSKIIPIHPSQWNLLGIRWKSKFYFAVCLTFGGRSSPSIFNQLSKALCWILLNRVRVPTVLHLLDDFLLIDPPQDSLGTSLFKLKRCFESLGVPLSEEKTIGPDTRLEFLGIKLNSIEMKASLPLEKLQRIRDIAKTYRIVKNISKQQLLSLLIHLNFVSFLKDAPLSPVFWTQQPPFQIYTTKYRLMKGADPTCVSGLICSITGMASLSPMKTWFIPLIPYSSSRMLPHPWVLWVSWTVVR